MLSDPGPRFREVLGAQQPIDDDASSLATENSDEEPLPGDPTLHIEAMLRKSLAPDERGRCDDDDAAEEDAYGIECEEEEETDEESGSPNEIDAETERDEALEARALTVHLHVLEDSMQQFAELSEASLLELQLPMEDERPVT